MAEASRIPAGQLNIPEASAAQDLADLKKLCSRLAGDSLCRCGGNLNGRFCLWSYYRIKPGFAGPDKLGAGGEAGKKK